MIYTLRNEYFSADINSKGAAVTALKMRNSEFRFVTAGESESNHKLSNNMFPLCGTVYKDKYLYEGNFYPLTRDGFIDTCEFSVLEQTKDRLILSFCSDEYTKSIYPFDFTLTITFTIEDCKLNVSYNVISMSLKKLLYSLGLRLNLCLNYSDTALSDDYYLQCKYENHLRLVKLNSEGCYSTKNSSEIKNEGKGEFELEIPLERKQFALLSKFDSVTLKSRTHSEEISIISPDLHCLSISINPNVNKLSLSMAISGTLPSEEEKIDNIRYKKGLYRLGKLEKLSSNVSIELKNANS